MIKINIFIHHTAEVSSSAKIGKETKIWNNVQIRERAVIGKNCIIAKNTYIDKNVKIGNNVKIQNSVSVYDGVVIEDGVFVGPNVCFSNDKFPRAINPNGTLKKEEKDWKILNTSVKEGASIGTSSVILPDIKIGRFAMVGAGSIVTKDVPDFGLVVGNPAKLIGFVCKCGKRITKGNKCSTCGVNLD